jgi:hypothetical protein
VFNAHELPSLTDGALIQVYVDVMVAFHTTENVAKANRLAGYQSEIFNQITAANPLARRPTAPFSIRY